MSEVYGSCTPWPPRKMEVFLLKWEPPKVLGGEVIRNESGEGFGV